MLRSYDDILLISSETIYIDTVWLEMLRSDDDILLISSETIYIDTVWLEMLRSDDDILLISTSLVEHTYENLPMKYMEIFSAVKILKVFNWEKNNIFHIFAQTLIVDTR